MLTKALLAVLGYFLCHVIDHVFSWDVFLRPIILGPVTGFLLGDIKTGIIIGGFLEAIYMGIFGVGGVAPADSAGGTVLATSFAILGNVDPEAAVALAVPIGAGLAPVRQITSAIGSAMHPLFMRFAEKNEMKKFSTTLIAYSFTLGWIVKGTIIFMAVGFGVEAAGNLIANSPVWLLNGLSVSGGLLAAVGLGLLATYLWSSEIGIFVVFGFVLAQYLGLSPIVIAALGIVVAVVIFFYDKRLNDLQKGTKQKSESEELYG